MIDNRRGVRVAWSGAKSGNTENTGNTGNTGNTLRRHWIAAGGTDAMVRGGQVLSRAALPRRTGRGGGAECESIAKSTASAGNARGLIFQWTACR